MTEFEKYIQRYLDLVAEDLNQEFDNNTNECLESFKQFYDFQNFSYAEGKWSVKCLLQHIIDTEKIFAYRVLCIVRGETQNLPGFDENLYAENSQKIPTELKDLCTEFQLLRTLNKMFYNNLDTQFLAKKGVCNHNEISVKNLYRLMIGHCKHHLNILNERYSPNLQ